MTWRTLTKPSVILAAIIGAMLGLGAFTFDYAEGTSYLSNNPKACVNCHVMNDQFSSWQKSSHHAVAVCNDCHIPPHFPWKYVAKARNGWNHSYAFTTNRYHKPIMITPPNAEILQNNCMRCHGEFVHNIVPGSSSIHASEGVTCVHCHQGVGHGARALAGGAPGE